MRLYDRHQNDICLAKFVGNILFAILLVESIYSGGSLLLEHHRRQPNTQNEQDLLREVFTLYGELCEPRPYRVDSVIARLYSIGGLFINKCAE